MWFLLAACTAKPPPTGLTGPDTGTPPDSGAPDSGTPSDTGTPSDPLPTGWSTVRFNHPPLGKVVTDGTTTWVVGGEGAVLQVEDAGPWVDLGVPPFTDRGIYDADARDGAIWAVTFDELAGFDSTAWTVVPLPEELQSPQAVSTRADGTVAVLAGDQPSVDCYYDCPPSVTVHLGLWDGVAWSVHSVGPTDWLNDLVETADGTLVAVGGGGWVARWDGAAWVDEHRGEDGTLRAVATDGTGIVAVGDDGLVVRGDLGALTVRVGGGVDGLDTVAVGPDGTAWALSWRAAWVDDGTGWAEVALPEDNVWASVGVRADGSAIVAGDQAGPTALVGDAAGWTVAWRQPSLWWVGDLWVDADGATWFGSHGAIGRWDAAGVLEAWVPPNPSNETAGEVRAVAGRGPDDVVAGGDDGVFDWDGTAWTWGWVAQDAIVWDVAMAPDGTAFAGLGAWLPDETQVPQLLRRDAGVWSVDPAPIPGGSVGLMALQAFAADDVYALTWRPSALLHFDGTGWTDLTGDLGAFYGAMWGRSGADLYLATDEDGVPTLLHWDGVAASAVAGAPPHLTAVSGCDDAVIVAGTDGWGDDFAPFTSILRDGVWTEMYRATSRMAVGGAGGTVVVAGDADAWRGPAATWAP
jgi:hypothetical protein